MQYSSKNFLSTIKIFRYFRTVIMQKRSIYLKLNTKILYKKCKLKNSVNGETYTQENGGRLNLPLD